MANSKPRGRGSALDAEKKMLLRKYLREAPEKGYSMPMIARMLDVHLSTVRNYKRAWRESLEDASAKLSTRRKVSDMVAADLLATGGLGSDELLASEQAKDILAAYPDAEIANPEEVMRVLSVLLREGADPVRHNAAKTLEDIRQRYAPIASIGPPPPRTQAEKVDRLAKLMLASGKDLTNEAVHRAFAPPTPRTPPPSGDLE